MCTWWNFRMYNRPCCATEGTTASVQQHETIRTLQYNSISLFDSPKLLLSSCHSASASASHSLGLRNRTDTPWAGYIFSIVVSVPGFFCGGCRSRPRQRSQGNCSLVLWDIRFFSVNVWIICNTLPRNRHNLHTRLPSVSPVFLMKGRALLRWRHLSSGSRNFFFFCSSSLLFCSFVFFKSPSLFHSQTLHSFLEHCWTQLEPPHKATPPLCHRVPPGVCVHLWLLKLEVCIT